VPNGIGYSYILIERSIILRQGTALRPSELLAGEKLNRSSSPHEATEAQEVLSLSEVQEQQIRYALRKFAGNHTRATRALGISQSTLNSVCPQMRKFVRVQGRRKSGKLAICGWTLNRKLKVYGMH